MNQSDVVTDRAPDHLARLLDALGSSLDDVGADGAAVAARSYLSRFHFDRLVSASLGEPPGAFRRRLLLERSAHQLTTAGQTILDIAVGAGYGSHEAYTRAFAKAYGRPPSEVRRAGMRSVLELELPCPSGIHYQPPGGLRLPADEKVSDMDVLLTMVQWHDEVLGAIIDRAGTLPDETLDRPITLSVEAVDDTMTLRELIALLVTQEEHWLNAAKGMGWPDDADRSIAGLKARHDVCGPAYVGFVRTLVDEGRLADTFIDTTCADHATHTYGSMVAHVQTFGIVRRTIALGALMSAGVTDLGAGDPGPYVTAGAAGR